MFDCVECLVEVKLNNDDVWLVARRVVTSYKTGIIVPSTDPVGLKVYGSN